MEHNVQNKNSEFCLIIYKFLYIQLFKKILLLNEYEILIFNIENFLISEPVKKSMIKRILQIKSLLFSVM